MALTWVFTLAVNEQGQPYWSWTTSSPESVDSARTFDSLHCCARNAHQFGFSRQQAFHVVPSREYVQAAMQEPADPTVH